MKIAVYTFIMGHILIVIPKRKAEGYLKSCFGWHSHNQQSLEWMQLKPDFCSGDYCDLDNHLDISLNKDIRFDKKKTAELLYSLKLVFPHIEEFKHDDTLFWKILGIK